MHHEEHEAHEGNRVFPCNSFVIFVFFVVTKSPSYARGVTPG